MRIAAFIGLPLLLLLQGCSWQEYFVLANQSGSDITIEYEIELPTDGFPIFDDVPRAYDLEPDGAILWDRTGPIADLDTARSRIKFILPPNKGLMIGRLSNDNYQSHDQYFINGRHFNLKHLRIRNGRTTTEIVPGHFDDHFTKQDHVIMYSIK